MPSERQSWEEDTQNTENSATNEQEAYLQERIARQVYLAGLITETKTERNKTAEAIKKLEQVVSPLKLTPEELVSEEVADYYVELEKANEQLETEAFDLEEAIDAIATQAEELRATGGDEEEIQSLVEKGEGMLIDLGALKQEQALIMAESIILKQALRTVYEDDDESVIIDQDNERADNILRNILPELDELAENYKVQTKQIATLETESELVNKEIQDIVFAKEEAAKVLEKEREQEIFDTIVLINDLLDWNAPEELIDEILKANTANEEPVLDENEDETEEIEIVFEEGIPESLFDASKESVEEESRAAESMETSTDEEEEEEDEKEEQSKEASKKEGESVLTDEDEDSKSQDSSLMFIRPDISALAKVPSVVSTSSSESSKSSKSQSLKTSSRKRITIV